MICNSSPLICLAKIGRLEILKGLFKNIIITEDVKKEILVLEKSGYSIIEKAIKEGWIRIMNPKNPLNLGLDSGENSVINLAKETNQELIIDDNKAIKIAISMNLKFLRTTTVILKALNKKLINKKQATSCIHRLVENGYYISSYYYSKILQSIDNYKN